MAPELSIGQVGWCAAGIRKMAADRDYQRNFYQLSASVRDREGRLRKAHKIAHVLRFFSEYPLSAAICLDIGCSSGTITRELTPLFRRVIGIDFDHGALANREKIGSGGAHFLQADAMSLPFASGSMDTVICAQVYEHVPDDRILVAEIYRVLKPGGMVFFSGPNKLFPIEPHYFLPFLHWLPQNLANLFLKLTGKGDYYYERSRTYWGLRRLTASFKVRDMTPRLLHEAPELMAPGILAALLRPIPLPVWRFVVPALPNFNWLLFKPKA